MVDWWFGFRIGGLNSWDFLMKGIVTYGYPWNPKPRFVQSKLRKLPDIQDGGSMDPPRSGWEVPYENRGVVTQVRYGWKLG